MTAAFQARVTDSFLDQQRQVADPPADELLRSVVAEEGKAYAKKLFDTLIRNIDLPLHLFPERVQDFVREQEKFPAWADHQKLREAHLFFVDHGPKLLAFLYYKSLPLLYACKNGAQVLVQTGRLAHREDQHLQFTRRIAETGQFLINVMLSRQLWTDRQAIHSILKVRLIHAAIRQFMPQEHWNTAKLGQPINQEDMAITLMTFSISLLDALDQFGVANSPAERAAYLHCWTVIGQLLGVDETLLPPQPEDAQFLIRSILRRQAGPSEAGRQLTTALTHFARKTLHSEKLEIAPEVLIRFLTGPEIAGYLGVSNQIGCMGIVLPEVLRSLFRWEEKLEGKSEALQNLIHRLSVELSRGMVGYFNTYKGINFQIPTEFAQRWNLE